MKHIISRVKSSSLIKGFLTTVVGSGMSRVFLVLTTLVVARMLTPDDFGQFSFVRSTMEMILSVCALNFSTLCTKYTTEIPNHKSSLHKLTLLFIFSFGVCTIVGLLLLLMPSQLMLDIFVNEEITSIFRVVGLLLPFLFLAPLIQAIYRGWLKFKFIGILQNVEALFFLGAAVLGVLTNGLVGALWAVVSYYIFRSVVFIIPFIKRISVRALTLRIKGFTSQRTVILNTIIPMFAMSFVEAPAFWIAQFILTKFGGFSAVAIMAVTLQVRNAIMIIPGYFFGTFMPFASKMNSAGESRDYFKKFDSLIAKLTLISFTVIFFLAAFGKFILSIFGTEYTSGYVTFILGVIALPLLLLNLLFRIHMVVQERQRSLLFISIGWNAIWILLLYLFVTLLPLKSELSFFVAQDIALIFMITPMYIIYKKDKQERLYETK